MTEQMEQMIFNEGYRRGKAEASNGLNQMKAEVEEAFNRGFNLGYEKDKAERHKMLDDGTLLVSVDDATAVTRVLVEDNKKNGDLYYADRPKGEWKVISKTINTTLVACSECGKRFHIPNYCFNSERSRWKCCPICCADMRGADDEAD